MKDFTKENKYGKCSLFTKNEKDVTYLVTGIQETTINDYYYCSTARMYDTMCGEEGKKYIKKRKFFRNINK
jgi:hypothetical protein